MESEPQAGGEDLATGRAESAEQEAEERETVAERRIYDEAQAREAEPRLGLRLRDGSNSGRESSEDVDRHR